MYIMNIMCVTCFCGDASVYGFFPHLRNRIITLPVEHIFNTTFDILAVIAGVISLGNC